MAHLSVCRFAAASVVMLAFAGAAEAQTAKSLPDISGRWKFRTDVLPKKGCIISGEIEFRKAVKPLDFACTFQSSEDCGSGETATSTIVRQTCMARIVGGEFEISSQVDRVVGTKPPGMAVSYAPDDFRVRPDGKGNLIGTFKSIREAAVRFWRDVDLVS
ncbi:MAG: hypothetical protein Q8R02_20990 [Hyphomonadaceae bacterium]|nr:hypothetical protein [Hyphomonadaceae bacterium]